MQDPITITNCLLNFHLKYFQLRTNAWAHFIPDPIHATNQRKLKRKDIDIMSLTLIVRFQYVLNSFGQYRGASLWCKKNFHPCLIIKTRILQNSSNGLNHALPHVYTNSPSQHLNKLQTMFLINLNFKKQQPTLTFLVPCSLLFSLLNMLSFEKVVPKKKGRTKYSFEWFYFHPLIFLLCKNIIVQGKKMRL